MTTPLLPSAQAGLAAPRADSNRRRGPAIYAEPRLCSIFYCAWRCAVRRGVKTPKASTVPKASSPRPKPSCSPRKGMMAKLMVPNPAMPSTLPPAMRSRPNVFLRDPTRVISFTGSRVGLAVVKVLPDQLIHSQVAGNLVPSGNPWGQGQSQPEDETDAQSHRVSGG